MESAVTDLPDPLSPTMASVSPGATENPTPSTATNGARPPRMKLVWRSRTSSSGGVLTRLLLRGRIS